MKLPQRIADLLSRCAMRPSKANHVTAVLRRFLADGPSQLQVVADFDQTMTDAGSWMVHEVLEREAVSRVPGLASDIQATMSGKSERIGSLASASQLAAFPPEELEQLRCGWWREGYQHFVKGRFAKAELRSLLCRVPIRLRPHCGSTLELCREKRVPFHVVSAGIGDLIEGFCRLHGHQHIDVVSNWMVFDENDLLSGFRDPVVHRLLRWNKSSELLPPSAGDRRNVLLLGDSAGDAGMANGLRPDLAQLKLAFLDDRDDHPRRRRLLDSFDLVLEEDASWDLPEAIIAAV